ncbi:hypothetical protein NLX83_33470 [Allokutzneria sp. A3M-2-11 16]|uniref:hypothetical protein n=1 Tax=Allokutzneria sp. A3M-2-11 16 TaxID=2962043 RepID=UPI0020B89771|nr:hypothetical protein [Allokutzneria sp. A3M-2-11 16]MCP3804194.1 hypothetical protein [Allokutzneria sp. A3M-2-11 16]
MSVQGISPKVVRGGFVLSYPGGPRRVIVFQYNPDTLTRTMKPQVPPDEPGDRLEALRLKGPPQENYKFDAEMDAADQLERPEVERHGLHPALAALEACFSPTLAQLNRENDRAGEGVLEIEPIEGPLTLLVLGRNRVIPVRITEFSVTEEAFDIELNPIRAKVSIGARVLTVDDVGFSHPAGLLFKKNLQARQDLAALHFTGGGAEAAALDQLAGG